MTTNNIITNFKSNNTIFYIKHILRLAEKKLHPSPTVMKITLVQESGNSPKVIELWPKEREFVNCIGKKHLFLKTM